MRAALGLDIARSAVLPLPPQVDTDVFSGDQLHRVLAGPLTEAVGAMPARGTEFDVLAV